MNILLLVGGLLFLVISVFFLVKSTRAFVKNSFKIKLEKSDLKVGGAAILGLALAFFLLLFALFESHPEWKGIAVHAEGVYKGMPVNYGPNLALALIGSPLLGLSLGSFYASFRIRYGKEKIDEEQRKVVSIVFFSSVALLLVSFLLVSQSLSAYLYYPLVNGLSITGHGLEFSTSRYNPGGLHLTFYGLLILSGAFLAYLVGDHKMYKHYHKHGLLEMTFLFAFPSGIVGARIWYVVGNWSREFAGRPFYHVFEVWTGGLTILGGAFLGILVGILSVRFSKEKISARLAADMAVPTVLLAQAVGRWGNFFNCEVYGRPVSINGTIWGLLPSWMLEQLHISTAGASALEAGFIHVPLFLIEGVLSLVGYFVITALAKKLLSRWMVSGDRVGGYFLWYGLVRIIMEPFRDTNFNMGTDNSWSICNSLIYILIGLLIIFSLHIHDYHLSKKKGDFFPLISLSLLLLAALFPFLPSLTTSTAKDGAGTIVSYGGFPVIFDGGAPLFLVAYILLLIGSLVFLAAYFVNLKNKVKGYWLILAGTIFSAIGTVLFVVGKNATSFDPYLYVNLSYGFIFTIFFSFAATLVAALYLRDSLILKKEEAKMPVLEEKSHD